ncbi:MAG: copper resistance protein CopC [Acidimicrobiia bacterium]|nr:copper resistance protein CopC [Acidimicrobiia bacterium]
MNHQNRFRRLGGGAAVAMVALLLLGSPASAHADLTSSSPVPGATLQSSPKAVTLSFTEAVSVRRDAIRVLDSGRNELAVGAPTHPGGRDATVRSSLPRLKDGLYVVVWHATSADAHPVSGSFTFSVGAANVSGAAADRLAKDALATETGDRSVGIAYGVSRFGVFVGLASLLGAGTFVVLLWPAGRQHRRVRSLLTASLVVTAASTVLGFLLEGPYTSAGTLGDIFGSGQVSAVWDTRFGKVWIARLILLVVAGWLVRGMVRRSGPLPAWWLSTAAATGVLLAATPGLSGHGSTGRWVVLALTADVSHVTAMAVWLGGLATLVMARSDGDAYPRVAARFSGVAFGAVVVLVVTGSFQAIRQLETISALWDSDYGRILLIKLIAFATLLGIAAWSRRLVHGRGQAVGAADTESAPTRPLVRLQRSVRAELVVGAAVLALTSMLVNTAPPKVTSAAVPLEAQLDGGRVRFNTFFGPARAGEPNDLHVSLQTPSGSPVRALEMRASLSMPDRGIARIPVEMTGSGEHFFAENVQVPFAGKWTLELHALLTQVDEATATTTVSVG